MDLGTKRDLDPIAARNGSPEPFWSLEEPKLFALLGSGPEGLSESEAARRTIDGYLKSPEQVVESNECAIETTAAN